MPSPIGAYTSSMPQHTYQQRDQAAYSYGQNQPNGHSSAPYANSVSYNVNTHNVTLPVPGHAVTSTASIGYGNQAYQGSSHRQHYPPAQLSSVVAPYVPQPAPPRFVTNPNSASHFTTTPPALASTRYSAKGLQADVATSESTAQAVSELEEGEVNDGESDTLAHPSETDNMTSITSRNPQAARNENGHERSATATSGNGTLGGPRQEDSMIDQGTYPYLKLILPNEALALTVMFCSLKICLP